jgi:hypothetical protein
VANPLDPAVFPRILVNFAPMAGVYEALAQVLPADLLKQDARTYVDRLARDAINDTVRRMAALTDDLLRRGLLTAFSNALVRVDPTNNVLRDVLSQQVPVNDAGELEDAALHTIRDRLQHFVDPKAMLAILEARPQVCAMLVDGKIKGTGFLVGPDLVMTARHVVKNLVAADPNNALADIEKPGSAAKLACVFGYEGTLVRPFPLRPPPPGAVVEKVAENWLLWSSREHYNDGVGHVFDHPPDIRLLFDCAIVRLARAFGRVATDSTGGQVRGWIRFDDTFHNLVQGQRLVLWQHPGEGPLVYGDGYYYARSASQTRIWYSAAADGGSSGAPCFDLECRVVAFHNAGWPTKPEPGSTTKEYNQGVAMAKVLARLPKPVRLALKGLAVSSHGLWSLGDDGRDAQGNVHPVLGRSNLIRFIESMATSPAARRVVVVEEVEQDRISGNSGKSFSTRILRAMMLSRPGIVLTLDARVIQDVEPDAFLTDLAHQAGVFTEEIPIPIKPTEERQLTRWWANDLPNWFGLMVEEAARQNIGLKTDPAGVEELDDEMVFAPTWIVLDDLHLAALSVAMRECLAGLIGITEATSRLTPGLASLRWLLIGKVPDFVLERSIEYEREFVSRVSIGEKEWLACCEAAFRAQDLSERYDEPQARMFYEYAKGTNPVLEAVPAGDVPDPTYLPTLARAAALAIGGMLRKAKQG